MTVRRSLPALWLAAGALLAALLLPLWGPMETAWVCYRRYAEAPRARAEVLHKLERGILALRLRSGPHADEGCTVRPARAVYERTSPGRSLAVVYRPDRPGACETVATVERSGELLYALSGGVAALALAILGLALRVHRRLAARASGRPS